MKKWEEEGFFFAEDDFAEKMNQIVCPFRETHYSEGDFVSFDHTRIHYTCIKNDSEKAAIVISHGFCEFIHKYDEMIYYFYQLGYSIYFINHRGHGFSERKVDELDKVYVESFEEYVEDFKLFMEQVVKVQSPQVPHILFAHSMGGAIGSLYIEKYPMDFVAAVLSSPMMEMNYGKIPFWAAKFIAALAVIAKKGKEYAPKQHAFDDKYTFATSSTLSEPRYAYVFSMREKTPEYHTYGGTYSWTYAGIKATELIMKKAKTVTLPILLFQAGRDTLVLPKAQERFVQLTKNTCLVRYEQSKHEIFNALPNVRKEYYNKMFLFIEEQIKKS